MPDPIKFGNLQEEQTNVEGHIVRDIEKPEARKKSDSFSGARPVSTASIDSIRRGSISNRPIRRGDSIAEGDEPTDIELPPQVSTQPDSQYYDIDV